MRDITIDLRVGGGDPPLYGTLTIYGTVPAVHGSGWVVTSETTLKLVNGQATLTGALERPSDGSLGHYHMIARDNCGRGATFRKFLPAGAGAISLAAMPDAWWQITSGVSYGWLGTPNASQSIQTLNGVETRRNRALNPSFENGSISGGSFVGSGAGSGVTTDWAHSGTYSLKGVASGAVAGDYRLTGSSSITIPTGMQPGKSYMVSAYTYCPTAITRNARSRRILYFYSVNGVQFTENFGPQGSAAAGVERVSHLCVVPANATGIVVGVGIASGTAGALTYVDDILVEETTSLNYYFDGSTKG